MKLQIGNQTFDVLGYVVVPSLEERQSPSPILMEASRKFEAAIMMEGFLKRISIPTREEWVGLNLLIRDDELRR
jgi:hypothetical protein